MSFTNQTTHYGLPQWIGSDKPTYLVDQNNAYQTIDAEIYNANTTAGAAQTAAEGAVATAGAASTTAADALSAAQTASSTADNALTEAQTANTNAQAAQTAAGAAQTAAQAAQEAAAGNSITNLAPAYDPTITYVVDDLVTAEGKLYKCIVAVTTPEQFDINKWDDVTTSEVYSRARQGFLLKSSNHVTAPIDTSVTKKAFIENKIPLLLNEIKSSLVVDEFAVVKSILFDNTTFIVSTDPEIYQNTDISTLPIEASLVYIGGGGLSLKALNYYGAGSSNIINVLIDTSSAAHYTDESSETNSSDMIIAFDKFRVN